MSSECCGRKVIAGRHDAFPYAQRARNVRERTRLADGAYGNRVLEQLRALPKGKELYGVRELLPAYFAGPQVAPADKLRLYHRLLDVEWLDRLCTAQFEPPVLRVASWYRELVSFSHELRQQPSPFPGSCPLMASGRGFLTEDTSYTQDEIHVLPFHPAFERFRLGDAHSPSKLREHKRPAKLDPMAFEKEALAAHLKDRTGTAELRAHVAQLTATHVLEVVFRGKDASELVIALGQDGSPAWRQAMDQLLPATGEYVVVLPQVKERMLYGEVRAVFPAALLPPHPLDVELRYRHVPGVKPAALNRMDYFATLESLRMSIRPDSN